MSAYFKSIVSLHPEESKACANTTTKMTFGLPIDKKKKGGEKSASQVVVQSRQTHQLNCRWRAQRPSSVVVAGVRQ